MWAVAKFFCDIHKKDKKKIIDRNFIVENIVTDEQHSQLTKYIITEIEILQNVDTHLENWDLA